MILNRPVGYTGCDAQDPGAGDADVVTAREDRVPLVWYRVEFDPAGNRLSCEMACPAQEQEGVFFVQAPDADRAWRKAQSLRVRALQRRKSEERIAQGKCPRCGVGTYNGSTRCAEFCRPEENKRQRNARAAVTEISTARPRELEPQLTRDDRLRLLVLQECWAAWRSPRNFLTWISGEIDALTTKLQKAG